MSTPTDDMTGATPGLPCDIDELKQMFLFEALPDPDLLWLCAHGQVREVSAGDLYRQGDPAEVFFVMLDGEIATRLRVSGDDIEVGRTTQRGVYAGAWMAYLGDRTQQTYRNSVQVLRPSRFFTLPAADFAEFMTTRFPMAVHMLEGLFLGIQNSNDVVGRRERLLALGSLSAGLTHELNNPAAASVRATAALRERVAGMRHKLGGIASGKWEHTNLETLVRIQEDAVEHVAKAPKLGPMEASDREDEIADWFDDHGVGGGWDLAPTFVQAGLDVPWLDRMSTEVDDGTLEGAVRWLNYTLETELLMSEIEDATMRISTLVGAAKQYSQLDRAPHQVMDVHELLNSTLVMLSGKLGGIQVVKDYDRSLPPVPVYAAELNQVWTNLIDNALQAMAGEGTLTIRTAWADSLNPSALVEIADTGPGIPADVIDRIFEPFFTTKPVGQGTGLGLDISWRIVANRHGGDLTVTSVPGDTRFLVRLPLQGSEPDEAVGEADS